MLPYYRIFLRRQVEKEETAWKESRFISGIFETVAAGLQVTNAETGQILIFQILK